MARSQVKQKKNPQQEERIDPGRTARSGRGPARAQRDDTPEARLQQDRSIKTHPTRAIGSRRKDKAR
jgi:hypothetical protein